MSKKKATSAPTPAAETTSAPTPAAETTSAPTPAAETISAPTPAAETSEEHAPIVLSAEAALELKKLSDEIDAHKHRLDFVLQKLTIEQGVKVTQDKGFYTMTLAGISACASASHAQLLENWAKKARRTLLASAG